MLNRIVCSIIVLLTTVIFVNAQGTTPEPSPTPFTNRVDRGVQRVRRLDRQHDRIAQQTYSNLYGQDAISNSPRSNPQWRAKMVSLYRKPSKKETAILHPDEKHIQNYAEFLKEKNTGIIKLIPEQNCGTDGKVINASPNCQKYQFPGAGSSYSFRLNTYRIKRLADITLVKNSLRTRSIFNGAIFVMLGDVPIENVGLNTSGVNFLSNYKPVKNSKEALNAAKRFAKGVIKDGYIYGRGVFVTKNNTFAMRSIAYRGKYRKSESGIVYNELKFDKRRDVIVTFRIVDVEADGSATLVWKILRETKSPKLKIYRKNK